MDNIVLYFFCCKIYKYTDLLYIPIQNRASHLHIPEPEVANIFKKKSKKGSDIDIDAIERRLKKSKREKPKSVEMYNQIANFWRIKGDTQASIECFRRALAVSPNNAEILHNLARVLFNLQYLDDAIFLTRRSLEVQPHDQSAWQQHFQVYLPGDVYQVCWGRISSCEEGKGISWLLGRIKRGKKG